MTTTISRPDTPATPSLDAPGLVARLRKVFASGSTRPYEWRRDQLRAMRRMLVEREPELRDALEADLGKPATETYATEVGFLIAEIDYTLKRLRRWMRPHRVGTRLVTKPSRGFIIREPLGVVLVIAPWNYPVQLALAPAVGAIAAGNAVVIKPSELTAETSAALARLIPEYLDPECIAIVEGGVSETTALLAERWDHILYTGNGTVGRVVMEAAAKHLTPVTLELGGKSPTIVDETADLEVAGRRIAWGKFLNAGQTCIAPDYVLVTKPAVDRLIEHMRRAVFDFYGPDPKASPDYARIIDDRHWKRLSGLVDSGTIALGGERDEATRYFAPTVLRDVAPDSPVMQDEIFGPVLPVLTVDSVDEAIAFVNERDKPLALYVFSKSTAVADRVLEQTSSGGACVNATMFHVAVPTLPFGGVGPSGMGAYHGRSTFETFSHAKSVLRKGVRPDPALAYPPYTSTKDKLLRKFL
ncbi:MAG: aldehyde dehydrogenase family protein [Acidimicrobiia bacterium]